MVRKPDFVFRVMLPEPSDALTDYAENLGILMMILRWPDIPEPIVTFSNFNTVAKTVLTTILVTGQILLGVMAAIRQIKKFLCIER